MACKVQKNGDTDVQEEMADWAFRRPVAAHIKELTACGVVTVRSGKIFIPKWEERQRPSDSGAERMKRYRERQRDVTRDVTRDSETSHRDGIEGEEKEKRSTETTSPCGVVVSVWNALPEPIKKIRALSSGRKTKLLARLREKEWRDHWREAIEKIPGSPFLCGKNDRHWIADFDFFVKPDSVTRILEGRYSNGAAKKVW